MPRRLLLRAFAINLGLFALLALVLSPLARAADDYPIATFGGTRTVLHSTDNAGVHTPHVIVDGSGATATSSGLVTVKSSAAETGHILKATPGNLYGFSVTPGAANLYVMVFDSATVPADGVVAPVKCYGPLSNSPFAANWGNPPLPLAVGISVAVSSTGCFSKTASATAFFSGDIK